MSLLSGVIHQLVYPRSRREAVVSLVVLWVLLLISWWIWVVDVGLYKDGLWSGWAVLSIFMEGAVVMVVSTIYLVAVYVGPRKYIPGFGSAIWVVGGIWIAMTVFEIFGWTY